ncbi:MAG: NACHT domain-containing protein [Cyanothece sp. SIO1E1]|nr:NACHT domain-containing protein [Cyanothece sp. SIO1E1]
MRSQRPQRSRGVILTPIGLAKLSAAKAQVELAENFGNRITFEAWGERTELDKRTIARIFSGNEGVDRRSLEQFFRSLALPLEPEDYAKVSTQQNRTMAEVAQTRRDWSEAVSVPAFYDRRDEFTQLHAAILTERCRIVAIIGMGGMGKTALAAKLAEFISPQFDCVVWKSLRSAPPLDEILVNLIQFLSNQQETAADLPIATTDKVTRLLTYLQQHRCLLIFDNVESILVGQQQAGYYQAGYEAYGELWRRLAESAHQSCLLLTSREKPGEVGILEGPKVRSLSLQGLSTAFGRELCIEKGEFSGSDLEWERLIQHYAGNPLALKMVAAGIQMFLGGSVTDCLAQIQQGILIFNDIRNLLEQQFERLSTLEQEVMYWLAINRELIALGGLQADLIAPSAQRRLPEALLSLRRRSLIEMGATGFTLQPVVMEYVTERLIGQVCEEITTQQLALCKSHALMKAQAQDYIRDTQVRLVLKPILEELLDRFVTQAHLEAQLVRLLTLLRETSPAEPSYAAGNMLNLLCQLESNLRGYDFSQLAVWQADLRNVTLHDVNFAQANLAKSVFAETFGGITIVAFSPDGNCLATGDTQGEIRLYRVKDGQHLLTYRGHTNWVRSLAFSPDGTLLASGSSDYQVKLWDVPTGHCMRTLQGHQNEVWCVAFSPNGQILVSGGFDEMAKLWQVSTGDCYQTLKADEKYVFSAIFSPDGQLLLTGGNEHCIKVWDIRTGQCLKTLAGHQERIRMLALSPDGQTLASGSEDHTLKLWNVTTGQCLNTLTGHSDKILSVALHPQGDLLASGSFDQTVKLWSLSTGQCLQTLKGHTSWVWSLTFNSTGNLLASSGLDQRVRLWDVNTGQCVRTLQGYAQLIRSVAFAPPLDMPKPTSNTTFARLGSNRQQILASGSLDGAIRLWEAQTGRCVSTLRGHQAGVWSVAFNPDGHLLASGSEDCTIKLWDVQTGQRLRSLRGHHVGVLSVAFNPDGHLLASGSEDHTIKLWDVQTGQCLNTLQGHQASIWSLAFNPEGTVLASGGIDDVAKLWDVRTGVCLRTLSGHQAWVTEVVFSPNGETLISTSPDQTIRCWQVSTGECFRVLSVPRSYALSIAVSADGRFLAGGTTDRTVELWDLQTGELLRTLPGHQSLIWSVGFCSTPILTAGGVTQVLASGGDDETIRLWDVETGACLNILQSLGPYAGMNITEATGLTEVQIASLKVLGAVEGRTS